MQVVIDALDDLRKSGRISDYVIGGATALLYYSEPSFTEDIDVFVQFEPKALIADLGPIYDFFKSRGAELVDEYIMVSGFPVQILLPYDELSTEAFSHPARMPMGNGTVKILGLEYLIAIMIQLGKAKYRERLRILLEENIFDEKKLNDILTRHSLAEKWSRLRQELQ